MSRARDVASMASGLQTGGIYPAGHIMQTVQTVKKDIQVATASGNVNWTDIGSFTASLTPKATSSKILITIHICYGSNVYSGFIKILAKTGSGAYADLAGALGDASGSRSRCSSSAVGGTADISEMSIASMMYLDSPSTTSAREYKCQFTSRHSDTMCINKGHSDTDYDYSGRGISTITLQEIAG